MKKEKLNSILFLFKFCLFLFLSEGIVPALQCAPPAEPDKIFIVLNKSFYVSGETIWYSIYILNKDSETRVAHVGLFNSGGKLMTDQKLKISDGTAHGSFDIPIEWNDDIYRLEVMTRWNLNFDGLGIFQMKIPVYNSSLPVNYISTTYPLLSSSEIPDSILHSSPTLHITFDKNIYNPGDSVSLEIESSGSGTGYDLSASVLDFSQIPYSGDTHNNLSSIKTNAAQPAQLNFPIVYQPEKNLSLEGAVLKTDKTAVINSNQLSVYLSGQHKFLRTKSMNGNFQTDLPDINQSEIIQVLDMNPFQEQMPYIKEIPVWDHITFGPLSDGKPVHTREIDQYIYHLKLRRKINEIFIQNQSVAFQPANSTPAFPKPDMHYDMSKFKLLKDLDDFITSVMLSARRYNNKGNPSFRLLNDQTNYSFMYHPWYLVDGLFTYDEKEILQTPFSSLTTVAFYTNYKSLYHFDPLMILDGIVKVTTGDHYWEKEILSYPNTFVYRGYYLGKSFGESQPELNSGDDQDPDLRPVVYWDPAIKVSKGKTTLLRFKATDNTGIFLVEISGVDENGKLFNTVTAYKVEQTQ